MNEQARADWFTASNGVQVYRDADGEIVTRTPTERGAHLTYHGNRADAIIEWQAAREVKPERLPATIRAALIDFAAWRIQAVWDDAGEVSAQVLAENIVPAQEFAWLSHQIPITAASREVTEAKVEAAARVLIAMHWDGEGCGTHGATACVNCFGPSPMSAHEVARAALVAAREVRS